MHRLLALVLIGGICASSFAAPLNADSLKAYAGNYSTDCKDPKALFLSISAARIAAIRDHRGIEARDFEEQLGYLGRENPPNYLTALVGQVKPGIPIIFLLFEDKTGQYALLEGDARVTAALGLRSGDKTRYYLCGGRSTQAAASAPKSSPTVEPQSTQNSPVVASSPDGGPNILGIQAGMTPDQVISAARAEPLLAAIAPSIQKIRRNFSSAAGGVKYLPGEAVSNIAFVRTSTDGGFSGITVDVHFDGLPGQERVVSIYRKDLVKPGAQPSYARLLEALKDKYGAAPTVTGQGPRSPIQQDLSILVWGFDHDGRAQKADAGPNVPCYQGDETPIWSIDRVHQKFRASFLPGCGAHTVFAFGIQFSSPYSGEQSLVQGYRIGLISAAVSTKKSAEVAAAVAEAQRLDREGANSQGSVNKPRI